MKGQINRAAVRERVGYDTDLTERLRSSRSRRWDKRLRRRAARRLGHLLVKGAV